MNTFRRLKFLHRVLSGIGVLLATNLSAQNLVSTPFNPRSTPSGETLFTELSPERTGIVTTNRYDDPRMWYELHREYHVGAIGTGVAVGDYDGDGKPDLFVLSKVESGRLFRNLGDWRFEDVTQMAGLEDDSGEWKQGVAFADVNNDGRLDLYICRFGVPNQLFINQGDGTFKDEAAARGLAVVDASGMACFADYDRDGFLDVYIQTNLLDATASPEGQRDYLFHNNGDGVFRNVTDSAGILKRLTQGHSATWWDQNEDGWLDLYVANDFDPPDFLYRNNRDGTFSNVIDTSLPHTPFSSMGADSGDVNNDGHIDFIVADMAGTDHEKTQRGLADSRARAGIAQNEILDKAIQVLYNALYLNTGTDRSVEAAYLTGLVATDWTWSTLFEDLNNDGLIDLFVTNGTDREQNNLDMISRRLAAVSAYGRIGITKSSPVFNQANLAYVNRGNLRFEEIGEQWGLGQSLASFGAAFGDFDGDGDLDLVHTNYQQGATVLRNDGQTGNSVIVSLRGTTSNRFGLGTRLEVTTKSGTQVRQLVSARGYLSTGQPVAHFGLGDEQMIDQLKIVWPSGRQQTFAELATGQLYVVTEPEQDESGESSRPNFAENSRKLFDEVSGSMGINITQREEKLEGTVPQPLLPRRFNRRGPGVAVGDLDEDGVDEIVFGATAVDGAKILRHNGAGYQIMNTLKLGEKPLINDGPPLIFDANGDGLNDLLFTAGGAALPAEEPEYEPRLWLNDGSGSFTPGVLPTMPISVGAAVAADFDRDGKLDLFLGGRLFPGYYPEPAFSALLLQRDGLLKDVTRTFASDLQEIGLVTSAIASDVDGDGWIDLIVALEWGGVHLFRNDEGKALIDVSEEWGFESTGTGFWSSLVVADFNHDGKLDYAIGNQGLNTLYTASNDNPMRLFAGDFAGSGEPQLVLAYNVEGALYPVASRGELASKIPDVLKRFPSNDKYAAATLEEIFGKDALAKADVYEAGEMRSGVLLSQPSGRYLFSSLPRLAQIAPVQGMVAADFDGDGHSDLLLVHNDYSPLPAHGRFDSGLGWLLLGDGSGEFDTVPLAKSGWMVPGSAKALVISDFDGDARPDAVVTRNNQSSMAFRNAASNEILNVALRLRGRGGNPTAIGARVSLESEGEILQISEVHAGGGYASQSTSTVFFSVPTELAQNAKFKIRWPSGEFTEIEIPDKSGYISVSE